MQSKVIVFGEWRCTKAVYYSEQLQQRGVEHQFIDVSQDPQGAELLRSLYADHGIKFPTLLIAGKRLRNPTLADMDKALARAELIELGVLHQPHAHRFVYYSSLGDATISYSDKESKCVLTHINTPESMDDKKIKAFVKAVINLLHRENIVFSVKHSRLKQLVASIES